MMNRILFAIVLLWSSTISAASGISGGYLQGGSINKLPFFRTTGLQTNVTELARFVALSGSGTYLSDKNSVTSHANTASPWGTYTLTAGNWHTSNASGTNQCVPVGQPYSNAYEFKDAATDIWALALSGYINSNNTHYANAKTHILEFTLMTGFEPSIQNGGNECALKLGAAVAHILEAAWLLENAGYASWTQDNRITLANWAATIFPVVSWPIQIRKNNWGIQTFPSAIAIASYVEGFKSTLTKHDATTVTPTLYIETAENLLLNWLSRKTAYVMDSDCAIALPPGPYSFGLQANGSFPDELRRTGGDVNCNQPSIAFACSGTITCSDTGGHFYQQKSTVGLAHTCEILRRLKGTGSSCFDLRVHGGDDPMVFDAAQFSTGGNFTSYYIQDTTQGFRYVAGEYYVSASLLAALDDGDVSVRGGRDYAYTRITHASGVAYP